MSKHVEALIVGAGQAGLATSYHLTQRGVDHVVLEQKSVGESWRNTRWDSFTLITPNWMNTLPGLSNKGDPDRFLTRDEVVEYLETYAEFFEAPIKCGVRVIEVVPQADGGFVVETNDDTYEAENVVIASGMLSLPKIPVVSKQVPKGVYQIHSTEYKNPHQLPDGAVLVVGSGNSGAQIAEELHDHGRRTYLSVGRSVRWFRRYRGQDITWWGNKLGVFDQPVDPSDGRNNAPTHISGGKGGHEINLNSLGQNGVLLLGHLEGFDGNEATFASDLVENLKMADEGSIVLMDIVDKYVEQTGMNAPIEDPPVATRRWQGNYPDIVTTVNLEETDIKSIIWATGYQWDFSWVKGAQFDDTGYPVQSRGVTTIPGLYFVGLVGLHSTKSGWIYGVGEDAAHIVEHMSSRR